jgi:hypothetical protein
MRGANRREETRTDRRKQNNETRDVGRGQENINLMQRAMWVQRSDSAKND